MQKTLTNKKKEKKTSPALKRTGSPDKKGAFRVGGTEQIHANTQKCFSFLF